MSHIVDNASVPVFNPHLALYKLIQVKQLYGTPKVTIATYS